MILRDRQRPRSLFPASSPITSQLVVAGALALLVGWAASPLVAEETAGVGPFDAGDAVKRFVIHPECRIELVASEPNVIDPVAIAFSPDGRMWVAEYSDYPNGPDPDQPGKSRIRVLTDEDGDGRYDKAALFAENLLFANGLMHWRDGLLVTTDGKLVFLRDTDGDGRADEETTWFEGFATENPQLRANHPTLGLDNHIYISNGLRGGTVKTVHPDWQGKNEPISIRGMDFRFNPLTGEAEAISGMGQFGLTFDDAGNRFVCSNRNPCKQLVLADHYIRRNKSLRVSRVFEDVSPAGEASRLYPLSRIWTTSNLHANQFTAACGVLIARGEALPESFYGNSFTCEPTSNLVHRDVLTERGPTFASQPGREGVEFLATKDEWFRPVNLAHGPDGAMYLVDMYRAVIEHPQFMPTELKNRPDLMLGTDRGRVYRIVSSEAQIARALPSLTNRTPQELIDDLGSSNVWVRETAHRLLLELGDASLVPMLIDTLASDSIHARRFALALLEASDALTAEIITQALDDPALVRQAARIAEAEFADVSEVQDHLRARLIRAIEAPESEVDGGALFQLVLSTPVDSDPQTLVPAATSLLLSERGQVDWYAVAIATGASESLTGIVVALTEQARTESTLSRHLEETLKLYCRTVASTGSSEAIGRIMSAAFADSDAGSAHDLQFTVVLGLAEGLGFSRARLLDQIAKLSPPQQQAFSAALDIAAKLIASPDEPMGRKIDCASMLTFAPAENAIPLLGELLDSRHGSLSEVAVTSLTRFSEPQVVDVLMEDLEARTPAVRREIIRALATSSQRISRLVDELETGRIRVPELDPGTVRILTRQNDSGLKERIQKLLDAQRPADRVEVLAKYQSVLNLEADALRGREVFAKNCATCHKIGDVGVNVAPDISDSRTKTPQYLLTNILDPNLAIDSNYFSYTIVDIQGRVHTGIISAETATSVTLKQPEGKLVSILRSEIEEMKSTGVSLMPVGLERNIDPQQMADLISFIKNWRYLDGQVPVGTASE